MDSNETSNLLAERIKQLELDAAGDKEQEAEIGASITPVIPLMQLEERRCCAV